MTPARQVLFDIKVCIDDTLKLGHALGHAHDWADIENAINGLNDAQVQRELLLSAELAFSGLNTESLRELQRRMTNVARPARA